MDLALNSNFSVHLDDRNDLAVTDGLAEFEQSVAVYLQDFLYTTSADFLERETAEEKIRLEVTRVARDHGELDSIDHIAIERDPDREGTFLVEVDYLTDESFQLEVEA